MANYEPSRKTKRPDSVTSQPAASANDAGDLPTALAAALSAATETLRARDFVYDILATTHRTIPEMLGQRLSLEQEISQDEVLAGGAGEKLKSRLREIDAALEEMRRRRRGAVSALVADAKVGAMALMLAKESVLAARAEFVAAVTRDFEARYNAAIAQVQSLWNESAALSAALKTTIPTPLPVRLSTNPVRQGTIERVEADGPAAVRLGAGVTRLAGILERLDSALGHCELITRAKSFDGLRDRLQSGAALIDVRGVWTVTAHEGIMCGLDALPFEHGCLVDETLLGPGPLQRAVTSRLVQRADYGLAVVTAA